MTPQSRLAERIQDAQSRQSEAARRKADRARRDATLKVPVTELELQVNAAVSISLKHRIAVYGMTGTGKTTWLRQLLPRLWQAFGTVGTNIIDSKGEHEYDDLATRLEIGPSAPKPAQPGEVLVWVIPGKVDKAQLDTFLQNAQAQPGPSITVADEVANLAQGDGSVEGFDLILKQGRISGKLVVGMSQEYAGNTRNLFGQATHVLRFHLRNQYDQRELNKAMGLPTPAGQQPLEPPLPFGFFYTRSDKPSPVYKYSGWQEFFRF